MFRLHFVKMLTVSVIRMLSLANSDYHDFKETMNFLLVSYYPSAGQFTLQSRVAPYCTGVTCYLDVTDTSKSCQTWEKQHRRTPGLLIDRSYRARCVLTALLYYGWGFIAGGYQLHQAVVKSVCAPHRLITYALRKVRKIRPMCHVNMKEFSVLMFHRCLTCILNYTA